MEVLLFIIIFAVVIGILVDYLYLSKRNTKPMHRYKYSVQDLLLNIKKSMDKKLGKENLDGYSKKEIGMNLFQRIVLIIGAIALILVIWTSPRISLVQGTYFDGKRFADNRAIAKMIDIRTAAIRSIGVIGATLFVFIALKSKHRKED